VKQRVTQHLDPLGFALLHPTYRYRTILKKIWIAQGARRIKRKREKG
jgi:hypothetical protein